MKKKKSDECSYKELRWDQKLKIRTVGRDDSMEDVHHHPYEPTPYCVLERLAESCYICAEDIVVDYGCGKGRVGCFLYEQLGCHSIGVEFDEATWKQALENGRSGGYGEGVEFVCADAAVYEVRCGNRFYFFNPFSVEVLQSVLGRIMESYYEEPREMLLLCYYPDDSYVSWLMTRPELLFVDEIDCRDLFDGNDEREKILIFEVCC